MRLKFVWDHFQLLQIKSDYSGTTGESTRENQISFGLIKTRPSLFETVFVTRVDKTTFV